MAVLVALTVGLVWWITAWAFGIKAFDAFLLTAALVVGARPPCADHGKPLPWTHARLRCGAETAGRARVTEPVLPARRRRRLRLP